MSDEFKSGRGGAREGAGRPLGTTGMARKMRSIRLTDEEYDAVRDFIKQFRRQNESTNKMWDHSI